MKRYLLSIFAAVFCVFPLVCAYSGEIDGTALVTGVHDGDTFYVDRDFYGSHTIRLADIDTAELGQPNSTEARDFLSNLVYDRTVYLDIDDVYTFDDYGYGDRLVCVAYVDYNGTHHENVNKALLVSGYATEYPHLNEFDQSEWSLYVPKQDIIPEYSISLLPILAITLVPILVSVLRRNHRN